jgi:hypothetical protein
LVCPMPTTCNNMLVGGCLLIKHPLGFLMP